MIAFACRPSPGHVDPTHPEHPRRLEGLADAVQLAFGDAVLAVEPNPASQEAVLAVHPQAHLDFLRRACEQAPALIDTAPTYVSPDSLTCALEAAGATLAALQMVLDGKAQVGFAAVRPPGHHATAERAMGFCLLNNVAIAARSAQAAGLARVMIVDFDVHHGNGTQAVFEADPSVLYVSTHQYGIYPGTGHLEERGVGPGEGTTVNVPLPSGAGDQAFAAIAREALAPLADRFRPDLLLVSAGFDAHWRDPLAGLQLTTPGFHSLASTLAAQADDACGGRALFVLEGGYDPRAVREGVLACMAALLRLPLPVDDLGRPDRQSTDISPVLRRVIELHRL